MCPMTSISGMLASAISSEKNSRTAVEVVQTFTRLFAPARLLRLSKGTLSVGADADVTVFDADREWVFAKEQTGSKSFNSPFYGWQMKGKAIATIVGGRQVWREPKL